LHGEDMCVFIYSTIFQFFVIFSNKTTIGNHKYNNSRTQSQAKSIEQYDKKPTVNNEV